LDVEQITGRLRALASDGGSIEAAQVKLIGLDEIREAAGARWPRMRERVRTGSMSILSQHIGPDDVIIPAGDGFLIMLAESKPGDMQRRCQQMRDALLSFYLGEQALRALRPEVNNHSLTPDGLSELIATSIKREMMVAKAVEEEITLAPVLATHEHKVGAMLAGPIVRASNVRRLCYNPDFILDGHHHDDSDYLELDIAVLDAALTRYEQCRANGGNPGAIGVTVHSSTMRSRRSRAALTGWFNNLTPEQRRGLFVCIFEIERGTPLISLSEWTSALRGLGAQVCLDFHYADQALSSVGASGAWAAGFSLPTFASAQRGARAERLRDKLEFWSKSLRHQGMRLFVHGFQDARFLENAGAMGVDLLTSDAHWPFSPAQQT